MEDKVYCGYCKTWVDYKIYGTIACVECEIDLEEEYGA